MPMAYVVAKARDTGEEEGEEEEEDEEEEEQKRNSHPCTFDFGRT